MVSFRHVSFPFFLCLLFLILLSPPTASNPLYTQCGTTGNYTANSTYESNLMNLLLPSLASNTSLSGGFLNATVGQIPDQIYGLAMCRGDTNASVCRSCLSNAIQDAPQLCAYNKGATVIYDDCLLRYSNQRFFSTVDTSMRVFGWSANNVTDRSRFDKIVDELMSAITNWAVSNSTRRFATGQMVNSTKAPFPEIYGLVQCTQDLSPSQCQQCLQSILQPRPTQLEGKQGGRVITASCNYRYETYKFFDGAATLRLEEPLGNTLAPAPVVPPLINPPNEEGKKKNAVGMVLAIAIPLATAFVLISIICICFWRRRKPVVKLPLDGSSLEEIASAESLLLDISTLRLATANFSEENKLGEGGFGAVYKGLLSDGQEIAVKKLSTSSLQGFRELRNELVLVAKLQHRNLVRLLGVCLEEQEKLLVYEYVPNRSLDTILFDPEKREQLNWGKRNKIIGGIARGLLYLHEESQLKIIHRDLKASNILLDADLNPKISDFGLARLFGRDQTQDITSRVVGTFGYMAPEYAMRGQFSIKSDVYSFGILILEIVTGRKNSGFSNSEFAQDIVNYVWERWIKGTILEILDPSLGNHCPRSEMLRCVHIGLLCVQENPSDRPNMSQVVVMLNSNSVSLQAPSRPAFCNGQSGMDSGDYSNEYDLSEGMHDQSSSKSIPVSPNEVSITELEPR
ncbi:cysteine-rich receptor-like protein kinase 6 isoform X1 [Elaeis guineensis]|uniref:Receptor-like protein kinase At4g00960 isoform X2 n=2 Tax=Elaeis guineensis var. tenera TaxID=51953 RepID=A0A8N4IHY2_ELAGV|nr:putative receptor-like protein kinase At4g00960 isoform X2 [Elaeis guineensis]